MGKFLGFCFFVAGLAAIYFLGVRPLIDGSDAAAPPTISVTTRTTDSAAYTSLQQRDVASVAGSFLKNWESGNYTAMYDLLAPQAQGRISLAAFSARYRGVQAEATVQKVATNLSKVTVNAPTASAAFSTDLQSTALGAIRQSNQMSLVFDRGHWGVDWYPALIFKQLEDPYIVHLSPHTARRGSILDRNGTPLAEDGQFQQVGVVPGLLNGNENLVLNYLSNWLHMSSSEIRHLYTLSWAQPDFFMPIATVTQPQVDNAPPGLRDVENNGVELQATPGRIYPQGSVAGILVGYVDKTTRHGKAGLEQTLDSVLSGKDGVDLQVMNKAETMTDAVIASQPAVDGKDVRLTLDLPTQKTAEHSLGVRNGAAVAIDPTSGAVLALASTPGYDPNRFEISATAPSGIGPMRSMFPRATLGTYPTGSIFKIVTMAAALERGGYTAGSMIDGPGVWYGLGNNTPLKDWEASGHGTITLQEALVQSCDTCFYQVGKVLDGRGQDILPQFARSFGFGSPTGIDSIGEAPGLVGDNAWKLKTYKDAWRTGDTVNLSIGQGFLLASPLQVATMLGAVGDSGVRHTPQLILSIGKVKGPQITPKVAGTLPVTADHLKSIMDGMIGVTTEDTGTATFVFKGFPWQVAGKTGTAQNPGAQPHAWFAAIAPAAHPQIALAVVVENAGEGSTVAGPIARAILQTYLPRMPKNSPSGPQQLTVPTN